MFVRIYSSFKSRVGYPYVLKHFKKSKYGKGLSAYKGRYQGQRCFFIGNGPSLHPEDLTTLQNNAEITFGFNRIYNIFEQTSWRPTFYLSQDEKMLTGCSKIVNNLDLNIKLIPIQLKWWHNIHIDRAYYFNIIHQSIEDPSSFHFSDDIAQGIYNASTCMYSAAQLAAYMGFSEIYLIGVDHHFRVSQNNAGEIIFDDKVNDYFSENYNKDKEHLAIPNTEKSTQTYIAMKLHCEKRGIKVFNATRGGKLEVFPRVDFDQLF